MDDAYRASLEERSPDARFVQVFIAQEHVVLGGAGVLSTGDAVRLMSAGDRRLTASAGPGAEILICETMKDLQV